jgi:hypothetical protein
MVPRFEDSISFAPIEDTNKDPVMIEEWSDVGSDEEKRWAHVLV